MRIHRTHLTAAALSLALVLTSCASGTDGTDSRAGSGTAPPTQGASSESSLAATNPHPRADLAQGGTVTLPMAAFPTNFNRFHVEGTLAAWRDVTAATDPGLYRYSPEGEVTPRTEYLSAMPQVEDTNGTQVITYDLNPEAVWNDGTPIDWTAFEATWKARRAPIDQGGFNSVPDPAYARIASVEKGATAHQVVVTLREPHHPVTGVFSHLLHPKLGDKDAFNTLMKDDVHAELRSGPFTVSDVDRQTRTIVLEPNQKWWGDKPLLDRVVFQQIEPSTAVPAARGGDVDLADVGNVALRSQVEELQASTCAPGRAFRPASSSSTRRPPPSATSPSARRCGRASTGPSSRRCGSTASTTSRPHPDRRCITRSSPSIRTTCRSASTRPPPHRPSRAPATPTRTEPGPRTGNP
ncbi:hypothetical protein GCM10025883_06160 [Mobilicoccus caccae]|uniref:Solute-binding protein family 5 domain-containing protein n=1 Tax=Mobilicoccus caccae TaxID=1859295 RepID=A0ABQ6IMC9_9MICO|nr:hypothetical protein GCM10025883_06160 [Mobilicoccus caccae]